MKRLFWLVATLGLASWLGMVEAGSKSSSLRFHQEVEVPLVEIHLAVENSQGNAVEDLTEEDVAVFLDGQSVAVGNLAFHGAKEAAGEASQGREGLPHLVICLDDRFLEPGDLGEILSPLSSFLSDFNTGEVLTSLFLTHIGLEMAQAPSEDPRRVLEAFQELQSKVGRVQVASEYRAILQEMARPLASGQDDPSRDQNAVAETVRARSQAFEAELDRELRSAASNLERLVPLVAGLPGRKTVLYVGGRLPTQLGSRLDAAWRNAFGRHSRWAAERAQTEQVLFAGPTEGPPPMESGADLFEAAAELASQGGVFIHTLDVGSLRQGAVKSLQGNASNAQAGSPGLSAGEVGGSLADKAALFHLAAVTGGLSGGADGSLEDFFGRLDPRRFGHYTLSFEAPDLAGGTEAGSLEIQLRSPEPQWTLHYPRRLHLQDRDQQAVERTVSALLLELPDNSLEAVVEVGLAGPEKRNLSRREVSVRLPLANLALLADGASHVGRISLFATSGNLASGVQPVHKAVLPVEVRNEDLLTAMGRDVEYKMVISVSSTGSLAIGIRDDFAPQLATVVLPLGQEFPSRSKARDKKAGGADSRGMGTQEKNRP